MSGIVSAFFTFPPPPHRFLVLAVCDDHSSRRLLAVLRDLRLSLPCFNRSGPTVEMLPEKMERSPDRSSITELHAVHAAIDPKFQWKSVL